MSRTARPIVEKLLRACLAELKPETRAHLADIEHELLASAANIDRAKPYDPYAALYDLIVQQTSLRSNVREFGELQDLVADVCNAGKQAETEQ